MKRDEDADTVVTRELKIRNYPIFGKGLIDGFRSAFYRLISRSQVHVVISINPDMKEEIIEKLKHESWQQTELSVVDREYFENIKAIATASEGDRLIHGKEFIAFLRHQNAESNHDRVLELANKFQDFLNSSCFGVRLEALYVEKFNHDLDSGLNVGKSVRIDERISPELKKQSSVRADRALIHFPRYPELTLEFLRDWAYGSPPWSTLASDAKTGIEASLDRTADLRVKDKSICLNSADNSRKIELLATYGLFKKSSAKIGRFPRLVAFAIFALALCAFIATLRIVGVVETEDVVTGALAATVVIVPMIIAVAVAVVLEKYSRSVIQWLAGSVSIFVVAGYVLLNLIEFPSRMMFAQVGFEELSNETGFLRDLYLAGIPLGVLFVFLSIVTLLAVGSTGSESLFRYIEIAFCGVYYFVSFLLYFIVVIFLSSEMFAGEGPWKSQIQPACLMDGSEVNPVWVLGGAHHGVAKYMSNEDLDYLSANDFNESGVQSDQRPDLSVGGWWIPDGRIVPLGIEAILEKGCETAIGRP